MSSKPSELVLSPVDFVALTNQVLDTAWPQVTIEGELSDLRVSKNRWIYFNLKDVFATVKFFGTVYMLPGPLADGIKLKVTGRPQLHPQFGFSVTVQSMTPSGEGSLRKAFDLLQAKLTAEGLFDIARKRPLPFPARRVGLVTSAQSAAYADFVKIINERWGGVTIELTDVQVQGEAAPPQIIAAINHFNSLAAPPDVLVVTRGGGSLDDLAAFNHELLVRAVAGSRVPTMVAIGHEIDICLAELAADQRASTPSNAAQLLVPDKRREAERLELARQQMISALQRLQRQALDYLAERQSQLHSVMSDRFAAEKQRLSDCADRLELLNPSAVLSRGYAILRSGDRVVAAGRQLKPGQKLTIELKDALVSVKTDRVELK